VLIASCIFYMAFIPAYILILFVTITIDYVGEIFVEGTNGSGRRARLVGSILAGGIGRSRYLRQV
jgi:alginate O-acetyltransferase complex protein AlgI